MNVYFIQPWIEGFEQDISSTNISDSKFIVVYI